MQNKNESPKRITWINLLHAIVQAAIAALTALGITSCTPLIRMLL